MGVQQHSPWRTWELALVAVAAVMAVVPATGGSRSALAAIIALLAVSSVPYLAHRLSWTRSVAAGALVFAVLVSPWLTGLLSNTFQGWHDHVWYWGRDYNLSHKAPDAAGAAAISPVEMAVASTWVPLPTVALDIDYAPVTLLVRGIDGRLVVYVLVGGP